jgi:predicted RNase H-like nuclease (RuvC/YqgF family)
MNTAQEKESASFQRQLLAVQKVLAETKAAHKEERELAHASPISGRADRQAMAQLAKTVKSLKSVIMRMEEEKSALEARVESMQRTAEEEAAYITALKHALDVKSKDTPYSSSAAPVPLLHSNNIHSGNMLEELVKARAAVTALRQHNAGIRQRATTTTFEISNAMR